MIRRVVGVAVIAVFVTACGDDPVRKRWPEYTPGEGQRTAAGEPNEFGFGRNLGPDDLFDDSAGEDRRFDRLGAPDFHAKAPASLAPLLPDGGVDVSAIGCVMEPGAVNPPADQACETREYSAGKLVTVTTYDQQGRVTSLTRYDPDGSIGSRESTTWGRFGPLTHDGPAQWWGAFEHERWTYGDHGAVARSLKSGTLGTFAMERTDTGEFSASFSPATADMQFGFSKPHGLWEAMVKHSPPNQTARKWTEFFDDRGDLVSERFESFPPAYGGIFREVHYQDGLPISDDSNDDDSSDNERYVWLGHRLSKWTRRYFSAFSSEERSREWAFDESGLLRGRRSVWDVFDVSGVRSLHQELWQENIYACGTRKLLFSDVIAVGASARHGRVDVVRDTRGRLKEELISGAAVDLNDGIDRRTFRYQCTQ